MDPAAGPSNIADARSELEACYRAHADALVRFAATQVGPFMADDLVAMVMVGLLARPMAGVVDARAYLYRAVANAARKQWRSTSRRERREALIATSVVVEHHEFYPEVIRALAGLSPQQRAVIHLAYWEDLTPPMIAGRLGVGEGTVRRQLARARAKLREALHGLE